MVEESSKERVVLIDTNVIVGGAIDLVNTVDSPEARIWSAFLGGRLKAAFSEVLLSEAITVSRRLMGKDFSSKLRSQILARIELVPRAELVPYISRFSRTVPREDLVHAALAAATGVEHVISNNRKFLRSLRGEFKFKCVTPKSFVKIARL